MHVVPGLCLFGLTCCSLLFRVLSLEESLKAMSVSAEEDDIPWDSLRDNRDLTVFTNWDPKERYRRRFQLLQPDVTSADLSLLFISQAAN